MGTLAMILLVILVMLICFCIILSITLVLYWIPKKLGSHVLGVIFASTFIIGLLYCFVLIVYDEAFFTKGDARKLLQAQQIELHEPFKILHYRHHYAFGDFSKTLIIRIDPTDKKRLIQDIKKAASYQEVDSAAALSPLYTNTDRYFGDYLVRRYNAGEVYIIESYKPSQKVRVAPLYVKIKITPGDTLHYKNTEY